MGTAPDVMWHRAGVAAGTVVVVAVLASWLANLPKGMGAGMTAVGQLTGFGCSLAALAAVGLMARVPIITNVVGSDRTVRWHRWAAVATVALLVVHIVATVVGYAAADKVLDPLT